MKKILLLTLTYLCLNLQAAQANIPDLSVLGYENGHQSLKMAAEIIATAPHNHVIRMADGNQYVIHMGDQPTESIDKIYQTIKGKVFYKAFKQDLINLCYCKTIHTTAHMIHVFFLSDNSDNSTPLYLQKL